MYRVLRLMFCWVHVAWSVFCVHSLCVRIADCLRGAATALQPDMCKPHLLYGTGYRAGGDFGVSQISPWKAVDVHRPRLAIVQDEELMTPGGERSAAKQARAGNDTYLCHSHGHLRLPVYQP